MTTTTITRYPRESVGAGDYEVQRTQMIEGPDRWGVMRFTGRGWVLTGTCGTRAIAKREAIREWKAALRRHR